MLKIQYFPETTMKNKYNAVFKCINGCDVEYSLNDVVYRCKECGNLLEVSHNLDRLRDKTADQWKKIFNNRRIL